MAYLETGTPEHSCVSSMYTSAGAGYPLTKSQSSDQVCSILRIPIDQLQSWSDVDRLPIGFRPHRDSDTFVAVYIIV